MSVRVPVFMRVHMFLHVCVCVSLCSSVSQSLCLSASLRLPVVSSFLSLLSCSFLVVQRPAEHYTATATITATTTTCTTTTEQSRSRSTTPHDTSQHITPHLQRHHHRAAPHHTARHTQPKHASHKQHIATTRQFERKPREDLHMKCPPHVHDTSIRPSSSRVSTGLPQIISKEDHICQ